MYSWGCRVPLLFLSFPLWRRWLGQRSSTLGICNAPHQHYITSYFQLNKVLLTSLQTFRHIEHPLPLLHGTRRHSLWTLLANLKFVCQFSPPLAQTYLGKLWPYDSAVWAKFSGNDAWIYAWPSRSSVIVLDSAEAINFELLGLETIRLWQETI